MLSIAKPHAMQQLQAEVSSLKPEVVVVTESWLTENHTNDLFDVPDYVRLCFILTGSCTT